METAARQFQLVENRLQELDVLRNRKRFPRPSRKSQRVERVAMCFFTIFAMVSNGGGTAWIVGVGGDARWEGSPFRHRCIRHDCAPTNPMSRVFLRCSRRSVGQDNLQNIETLGKLLSQCRALITVVLMPFPIGWSLLYRGE